MKRIIFILVFMIMAHTSSADDSVQFQQDLALCEQQYQQEKTCEEEGTTACYHQQMNANKNIQQCYKRIAVSLFENFYNLSNKEAEERFDRYNKSLYDQFLFVYSESDYCQKNNCGIAIYLYSEHATTEQLRYYINKIITSVTNR